MQFRSLRGGLEKVDQKDEKNDDLRKGYADLLGLDKVDLCIYFMGGGK